MKGLLFADAWAAAARIPICMLSLDKTEEDRLVGCLFARLMPKRSCCFSSLIHDYIKVSTTESQKVALIKISVSIKHLNISPNKQHRVTRKKPLSTDKKAPPRCQQVAFWLPCIMRERMQVKKARGIKKSYLRGKKEHNVFNKLFTSEIDGVIKPTTIYMAKSPDIVMQIPSNQFLSRWLHRVILQKYKHSCMRCIDIQKYKR